MEAAVGYDKTDTICEKYFKRSLKNLTQKGRGGGSIFDIGEEKEILRWRNLQGDTILLCFYRL